MTSPGFFEAAGMAGLLLLALSANTGIAVAGDGAATTALSESLAALSGQRAKSASTPERQLGLVGGRLENTRGARLEGRNVNASALAIRFSGDSDGKTVAYETKNLLAPEKERRTRRTAVWFGGNVTLDSKRAEDPRLATIYTNGLTFGIDTRVGRRLLVGSAVGMAYDQTGVGAEGSLQTRYLSNTLYGSLTTSRDTYLDVMLGASRYAFRSDTGDVASFTASDRSATQAFGLARFSRQFQRERLRLRPYGQARYSHTQLSAFSAQGENSYFFAPSVSDFLELTLGVRGETSARTTVGKIAPHAILEISRALKRASGTVVTSMEKVEDVTAPSTHHASRLSARTGLNWTITDRATINGEYSMSSAIGNFDPKQEVSARFKLKF